jgi:hypothetical protein
LPTVQRPKVKWSSFLGRYSPLAMWGSSRLDGMVPPIDASAAGERH